MLTEHEQLADHEARINKQELMQKLQPLQQPLDNIAEINREINDMHKSKNCGEITLDSIALAVLPAVYASQYLDCTFGQIAEDAYYLADAFIGEMNKQREDNWQPIPPPPEKKDV